MRSFREVLVSGWLRLRSSDIELTNTQEQITGTDTLTNDLFLWGAGVHPWSNVSLGLSMKYFLVLRL